MNSSKDQRKTKTLHYLYVNTSLMMNIDSPYTSSFAKSLAGVLE